MITFAGPFGRFVIDRWIPLTRRLWSEIVEAIPFYIHLTDAEKDALTAMVFFIPLGITSMVFEEKGRNRETGRLLIVFLLLIITILVAHNVFADVWQMLLLDYNGRHPTIVAIPFAMMLGSLSMLPIFLTIASVREIMRMNRDRLSNEQFMNLNTLRDLPQDERRQMLLDDLSMRPMYGRHIHWRESVHRRSGDRRNSKSFDLLNVCVIVPFTILTICSFIYFVWFLSEKSGIEYLRILAFYVILICCILSAIRSPRSISIIFVAFIFFLVVGFLWEVVDRIAGQLAAL